MGPELGQCCGGHVKLLTEYYDEKAVTNLKDQSLNIRSISGATEAPKKVKKLINKYKTEQISFDHKLSDEWLIEKVITARPPIWIWGAGHVGSAILSLLAPMPNLEILLVGIPAKTAKILKVSKKDSFKQYIAYHEGWGNYKNYKNNKKVINLAKKVEKQASIYKKQLSDCKNSLSTNKYIVFNLIVFKFYFYCINTLCIFCKR